MHAFRTFPDNRPRAIFRLVRDISAFVFEEFEVGFIKRPFDWPAKCVCVVGVGTGREGDRQ